jgi:putative membrane protein
MNTKERNVNLNVWRRVYRQPVILAILFLAVALALGPSTAFGTAALGSEATVATGGGASERIADVAKAGITSERIILAVDADGGDDDHHMWGGWWDSGWWIVMPILMVLFWATVIGVVVWAVTQFTRGERGDGGRALDIAQERYARGEISREEFEQIRRDLR